MNKKRGYNTWIIRDCNSCEYGDTTKDIYDKDIDRMIMTCDADPDYKCPESHYQTCVVISVQGDLRDRLPEQTQEEFQKFLDYIESKYQIRDYSLNIKGE